MKHYSITRFVTTTPKLRLIVSLFAIVFSLALIPSTPTTVHAINLDVSSIPVVNNLTDSITPAQNPSGQSSTSTSSQQSTPSTQMTTTNKPTNQTSNNNSNDTTLPNPVNTVTSTLSDGDTKQTALSPQRTTSATQTNPTIQTSDKSFLQTTTATPSVTTQTIPLSTNSLLMKQAEIASAPSHVASPALTYSSNEIAPILANVLFYLGLVGICIGGVALYATRTKLIVAQ